MRAMKVIVMIVKEGNENGKDVNGNGCGDSERLTVG